MTRTPLIAGNWKMNTTRSEAESLAGEVAAACRDSVAEVLVCPPFPWLIPVAERVKESGVLLGAQDCWTQPSGAVTGAVSPSMLAELCSHVIVGHSERRSIFQESNDLVARKALAALDHGLTPVVCVGESLEVRQAGGAQALVSEQLQAVIALVGTERLKRIVIAYEPVWAIGTGVAASANDAQEMALHVRRALAAADPKAADTVRILYGGSVTPANASEILGQPDVDGALVGGASLKAAQFLEIIGAAG